MKRALRSIVAGIASFGAATAVVHLWCGSVFALLGYSFQETIGIGLFAVLLPAVASMERGFSRLIRFIRPIGARGSVLTGFCLAALLAWFWLTLLGEDVMAAGNLADVVLAGLVFGAPAGLASHEVTAAVGNIVDSRKRVL